MRHSLLFAALLVVGCSGSSNEGDGGGPPNDSGNPNEDAGGNGNDSGIDAGTESDAGMDAGVSDAGPTDAGPVTLTVKNYKAWCAVSIDGGAFSKAASQTVDVGLGIVPLAAKPASKTFILGLWHLTTGDTGSGDLGTIDAGVSYTTADVTTSSACAWVCCPFTDGGGCNITNQCP
jgi:hypothetical protein